LLSEKRVENDDVLISLDVTSLFTNVPLNSIKFIFSSTYFTFNNVIYKQTFGTPMGSPLSPVIADIVMRDLENDCLRKLNFELTLYYRYVDDIVLTSPVDRSINFLDLRLTITNNIIYIDWFQKKTFSGRFLSFHSNHPMCQNSTRKILISSSTFF